MVCGYSNKNRHLFPLRKTKVLRYGARSPSKYLTSSNGILSEALSHDTFSQCSCINSFLTTSMRLESMLKSLESIMDLYEYIQFKSKFKSKIKIKFWHIQTNIRYRPTLGKSSMKSKIEFKYNIRKQNEIT